MAHYPLNHPLRRTYRVLATLGGLYLLAAGIVGVAGTWGEPFFHRGSDWALGLRMNPAGSWLVVALGALLLIAVAVGGNVYHRAAIVLGYGLCGIAMLTLAFIQTDANVLNVSMANVIALTLLGVLVLTAGLYGKVGSTQDARTEAGAAHQPR